MGDSDGAEAAGPPPERLIQRATEYLDGRGARVVEMEIVSGEKPDGWCRFHGVGVSMIEIAPGVVVRGDDYRFSIGEATTIGEAFDLFERYGRAAADQYAKVSRARMRAASEQQRRRLVLPGAAGAPVGIAPGS